jgi:hypothetical protein
MLGVAVTFWLPGGGWVMAAPFDREPGLAKAAGGDLLASWAQGLGQGRAAAPGKGSMRFAFYGRVSTEDWQDPVTSRARQLQQATMLVAGRGVIVAEPRAQQVRAYLATVTDGQARIRG